MHTIKLKIIIIIIAITITKVTTIVIVATTIIIILSEYFLPRVGVAAALHCQWNTRSRTRASTQRRWISAKQGMQQTQCKTDSSSAKLALGTVLI